MQMCKAFGICHHVDLKNSYQCFIRGASQLHLEGSGSQKERCTEKVAHYVRKGDWHSEIVGVEVYILDRALISTKGGLRGINKGWVYSTGGK